MEAIDNKPAFGLWDAYELYQMREKVIERELQKDTISPKKRQELRGKLGFIRGELVYIKGILKKGGVK